MQEINLKDYQYTLPQEKIALFPPKERGLSKLLVFQNNTISHDAFRNISSYFDDAYFFFFNNTKVLPARLYFQKETGAIIEIFLLNPVAPTSVISLAMESKGSITFECVIGKLKKWKEGSTLSQTIDFEGREILLEATLENKAEKRVRLNWNDATLTFAELITHIGNVPLPPYLNRKPIENDKTDYQTVYSKKDGAVAAPTAGLHFTDKTLSDLKAKNIASDELTLHVGAGTFQPIKEESVLKHNMHKEQVVVSSQNLENLLQEKKFVAVGTTSMRTLESVYWFGVKLILVNSEADFFIEKLFPYDFKESELPTLKESISAVLKRMEHLKITEIVGETEIFIFPSYTFRVCKALVTNFHQPSSTLMLLVAAFVGEKWREIYEQALNSEYRFLSYGDSSILFSSN